MSCRQLAKHLRAGVRLAVAAAKLDASSGMKRLVGYVTPSSVGIAEAVAHCRARLLPAMVPSVVVALDALPLLPNGKVDVASLPEPAFGSGAGEEDYLAPATELERALQEVWGEVLGAEEPISAGADFFAAGGTSLLAIRALAGMRSAAGVAHLPPTLIHTHRTIRAVAAAIEELACSLEAQGPAVPVPIEARDWPDSVRPLSASQEQMWALHKADPGSSAYNMPVVLESVGGRLASEHVQAALNFVARRHEALR